MRRSVQEVKKLILKNPSAHPRPCMGSYLAFGPSARRLKEAIRTCQLTSLPKPVTRSWIPGGRRLQDETHKNRQYPNVENHREGPRRLKRTSGPYWARASCFPWRTPRGEGVLESRGRGMTQRIHRRPVDRKRLSLSDLKGNREGDLLGFILDETVACGEDISCSVTCTVRLRTIIVPFITRHSRMGPTLSKNLLTSSGRASWGSSAQIVRHIVHQCPW